MSKFLDEVMLQPGALAGMVEAYRAEGFKSLRRAAAAIAGANAVVFCGMGSSFFAPLCRMDEFAAEKRALRLEAAQILERCLDHIRPGDVAAIISQSGESIEIKRLCERLRGERTIIGITNDADSTLARASNILLPLHAGEEASITNRTFTNTLALLQLLSGILGGKEAEGLAGVLSAAAGPMRAALAQTAEARRIAARIEGAGRIHFIGQNGDEMALAEQAALVFMEGAGCDARAFSLGAFRHGPIEVASPGHRVVLFAFDPRTHQNMLRFARELRGYGSRVALVTNQDGEDEGGLCLRIAARERNACLLAASVAMELLLAETAALRHRVAGDFRITRKVCDEG